MTKKKSIERKWVAIAVAAYLLIMVDLLASPTIASLLPAQHVPNAPGGSEEGKTGSPRKALGGGFNLKGAIVPDSDDDFGKKKRRKVVESRSLRVSPIMSPPAPLLHGTHYQGPNAPKAYSLLVPVSN